MSAEEHPGDRRGPLGDEPPSLRASSAPPPPPSRGQSRAQWWPFKAARLFGPVSLVVASTLFVTKIRQEATPRAAAPVSSEAPAPTASESEARPRADAEIVRDGRSSCGGGALVVLPDFASADVPASDRRPLVPRSHAEKGSLFVRGYGGDRAANHMSHVLQMASTALPKLAERWGAGKE